MGTSAPEAEARLRNPERAASVRSTLGRNFGRDFVGRARVLDDSREIQHCVIVAASSDPLVQRLALDGAPLSGPMLRRVCSISKTLQ